VSRYDDFSGTEALLAAGRANAEMVLDFWESGAVGDTSTEPSLPPLSDTADQSAAV
jgi:hypothetical protein